MKQYQDQLGLDYSAGNPSSIEDFSLALEGYLASRSDVMPRLDELLATDADMPMALCFRGYLMKLASDPRFVVAINRTIKQLDKIGRHLNDREQRHLGILKAWSQNQTSDATQQAEALLKEYPKDMLGLRVAHYLHFYAGDATDMRDSVARSLEVWQPDDAFYGYLLGMYSFGLEESGDYDAAERAGKQAVERNREDIWAAHAVTHVFEMQQRFDEGIPWIEGLSPAWSRTNNFVYHLHWHKALFHLGLNQPEVAREIYDDILEAPIADDFYLDVCNAASLLWRLQMTGTDVGDRWQALQDRSRERVTDNELPFASLHYLMTPALLQDQDTVRKALRNFEAWSREPTTQGEICSQVGLPLARALIDIGSGEYARGTNTLSEVKHKIVKIGGSHAQRHLFEQLLSYYALQANPE